MNIITVTRAVILACLLQASESLKCLNCDASPHARDCGQILECSGKQVCSAEQYVTSAGYIRFKTSCRSPSMCGSGTMTHSSSQTVCAECCDSGDLCNAKLCNEPGYGNMSARGPICYECDHLDDPKNCDFIKVCSQNNKCSVLQNPITNKFDVGCMDPHTCGVVSSTGACSKCCGSDMCNTDCAHHTTLTPPTTISTAATVTKAGTSACYSNPCVHGTCSSNSGSGFQCTCSSGYTGTTCDTDIDDCSPNPCVTGTCHDHVGFYHCDCDHNGYTGRNCQISHIVADHCSSNPCHHGTCLNSATGYTCSCHSGYTGATCMANIDDCLSNPCVNGICIDGVNSVQCLCIAGFTGTLCDKDIDECATNPCVNGVCVDKTQGFDCHCVSGYTGALCDQAMSTMSPDPLDCKDIQDRNLGSNSGPYLIKTGRVYCNMAEDGGGWTVLLSRQSKSVDFETKDSNSYAIGFGDINTAYWLGLEHIHAITSNNNKRYQLRIDIIDEHGNSYHEIYDDFSVGPHTDFRLHVGAHRGTAGDSLSGHDGMPFTTFDRDRDTNSNMNCARYLGGGWWFHNCYDSCLTCPYIQPGITDCASMSWNSYAYCKSLVKATMMIRPY